MQLPLVLFPGVIPAERFSVADAGPASCLPSRSRRKAIAARLWYAERSQSAADAFLAELDHGIESISEASDRWPLFVHDTRRYLFHRFPFQIVYRVANDH